MELISIYDSRVAPEMVFPSCGWGNDQSAFLFFTVAERAGYPGTVSLPGFYGLSLYPVEEAEPKKGYLLLPLWRWGVPAYC